MSAQTYNETVEREGDEIPIILEIEWRWDTGVYLEPGHSRNGYGKGWYCKTFEAKDDAGREIHLTEDETEHFQERYHPNAQR